MNKSRQQTTTTPNGLSNLGRFEKWKVPENPLNLEKDETGMFPTKSWKNEKLKKYYLKLWKSVEQSEQNGEQFWNGDLWRDLPANGNSVIQGKLALKTALAFKILQLTDGEIDQQIDEKFVEEFINWMLGKSKYNLDKETTPWGTRRLVGKDINAYLHLFVDKKIEFIKQLTIKKAFIPQNLADAWDYFKYICCKKEPNHASYLPYFNWWTDPNFRDPNSAEYRQLRDPITGIPYSSRALLAGNGVEDGVIRDSAPGAGDPGSDGIVRPDDQAVFDPAPCDGIEVGARNLPGLPDVPSGVGFNNQGLPIAGDASPPSAQSPAQQTNFETPVSFNLNVVIDAAGPRVMDLGDEEVYTLQELNQVNATQELEQEAQNLRQLVRIREEEISRLREPDQEKEKEVEELKKTIGDLTEKINYSENLVNEWRKKAEENSSELSRELEDKEERERTIKELLENVDALGKEKDRLLLKLDSVRSSVQGADEASKVAFAELNRRLEDSNAEREAVREELSFLRQYAQEKEENLNKLTKESQAERRKMSEALSNFEQTLVRYMKSELENIKSASESIKERLRTISASDLTRSKNALEYERTYMNYLRTQIDLFEELYAGAVARNSGASDAQMMEVIERMKEIHRELEESASKALEESPNREEVPLEEIPAPEKTGNEEEETSSEMVFLEEVGHASAELKRLRSEFLMGMAKSISRNDASAVRTVYASLLEKFKKQDADFLAEQAEDIFDYLNAAFTSKIQDPAARNLPIYKQLRKMGQNIANDNETSETLMYFYKMVTNIIDFTSKLDPDHPMTPDEEKKTDTLLQDPELLMGGIPYVLSKSWQGLRKIIALAKSPPKNLDSPRMLTAMITFSKNIRRLLLGEHGRKLIPLSNNEVTFLDVEFPKMSKAWHSYNEELNDIKKEKKEYLSAFEAMEKEKNELEEKERERKKKRAESRERKRKEQEAKEKQERIKKKRMEEEAKQRGSPYEFRGVSPTDDPEQVFQEFVAFHKQFGESDEAIRRTFVNNYSIFAGRVLPTGVKWRNFIDRVIESLERHERFDFSSAFRSETPKRRRGKK